MKGMRAAIWLAALATAALCAATAFGAENFTPEQIRDGLIGKTKQEVKEMLGAPTMVSSMENDETGQWNYTHAPGYSGKAPIVLKGGRIVFDPVAEKAAAGIEVGFKGGVAFRVKIVF